MRMKLAAYLKGRKITQEAFAELLGVSQGDVSRYAAGTRMPRPGIMAKITAATHGEVTPNDFFDIPEPTVENIDAGILIDDPERTPNPAAQRAKLARWLAASQRLPPRDVVDEALKSLGKPDGEAA